MLLRSLGEHFLLACGKPLAGYRNLFSKPPNIHKANKISTLTASTDFYAKSYQIIHLFHKGMPLL
jgi:hypothetical protein